MATLNGKIFSNLKIPLTYLHKGCRNAHPFWGFSKKLLEKIYPFTCSHWEVQNYRVFLKNFYLVKSPLTYLELQSQMTPYFTEKMRKCFFRLWVLYFCFPQKVSSLIPTENSKMHTLNRKKFLPIHLFGIGVLKRTLFSEKRQKIFLKRRFASKTSPHLFPLAEDIWG